MNPRVRRLMSDAHLMRTEFAGHEHIFVDGAGGDPPEQYRITYRVPGVTLGTGERPLVVEHHRVVVQLPAGYPRQKPYCTVETQVFHPNFGANVGDEICIGDYWTPAQSLADIVVKIGEMLQYREYNVKSPLNAVAGRWAAENEGIFPVGEIGLYPPEAEISLGASREAADDDTPEKLELTLD